MFPLSTVFIFFLGPQVYNTENYTPCFVAQCHHLAVQSSLSLFEKVDHFPTSSFIPGLIGSPSNVFTIYVLGYLVLLCAVVDFNLCK